MDSIAGIEKKIPRLVNNAMAKKEMEFVLKVDFLLQQEDIEGFIEAGAANDEYLSEAEDIAAAIKYGKQSDLYFIVEVMSRVWKNSFNLDDEEMTLRLPAIQRIAREIAK